MNLMCLCGVCGRSLLHGIDFTRGFEALNLFLLSNVGGKTLGCSHSSDSSLFLENVDVQMIGQIGGGS